ncbi:MAG: S8 family serine peptidase, partial [Candidatus Paceibacterota bacterium]
MKKIKYNLLTLSAILLLFSPNFVFAEIDNRIVYTKCDIDSYEEQLADNFYLVDKTDTKQECIVQSVPDQRIYLANNDTDYSEQWALRNTGQDILGQVGVAGIDIGFTNAYPKISNTPKGNTKIAVIDTGVNIIPELSGQVIAGYNFISNSNNANDDNGHGTFVTSVIASKVNNSAGIAGVNDRVNIIPIKILDSEGKGFLSDLIKGIQYAIDQNANIINLSLASTSFDPFLNNIIELAYQRGIIVVAAAGNSGNNITSPSVSPLNNDGNKNWVIGVGAIDNRNNRPDYSNYGLGIDVVAPGDKILGYNN